MKRHIANISKEILQRNAELAQIILLQLEHGTKSYDEIKDIATKANFTNDELFASMGFLIKESHITKKNNKWELIRE